MAIKVILFDCMDTLVHMDIPSLEVYADWAFSAARDLGFWETFESFRARWNHHRGLHGTAEANYREGTIRGRIRELIVEGVAAQGRDWSGERIDQEAGRVLDGYWKTYRAASFVPRDVPATLEELQKRKNRRMGVVSNFMVEGGIPELLRHHSLDRFFSMVLVSCDVGFRKPSEVIYQAAIRAAGVSPEEILFIGDHPVADYQGPRAVGMHSLLYDPRRLHADVEHRFESFREVIRWVV